MHLYIDESGPFANPQNRPNAVSWVAALVIPDAVHSELPDRFAKLVSELGDRQEPKGRDLAEHDVDRVLRFLIDLEALAEITAIDLAIQAPGDIEQHRRIQADRFIVNITPETQPGMVRDLHALRDRILRLPPNLHVQMMLTIELVLSALQTFTHYFVQRLPKGLGALHWVLVVRSDRISEFESLWTQVVLPGVQSRSLRKPFGQLSDGDYSHFERFSLDMDKPPPHLDEHVPGWAGEFRPLDVRKLLHDHIEFVDSRRSAGLQLVESSHEAARMSEPEAVGRPHRPHELRRERKT